MMQSVVANNSAAQLMRALNPDNIKVDGRDNRDRLAFAARFAELIMFYNQKNQLDGNWKPFFVKDPLILLAVISKTDYTNYHRKFSGLQQQIKNSNTAIHAKEANKPQPEAITTNASLIAISQLFLLLQELFCVINDWVNFMQMDCKKYDLSEFVIKKIRENIASQLWLMIALQQSYAASAKAEVISPEFSIYQSFNSIWQERKAGQENYRVEINSHQQNNNDAESECQVASIEELSEQLYAIYHQVFSFFLQVIDAAKQSFYQMENQPCDYPDTALLITFSQLMENQNELLNQFTGKHLDFYYKDVLQQAPRSQQPDQASVCIQLADNIDSLNIPAGTEFIAGKYPDKSDIIFASLVDTVINRAAIRSAFSLFYSSPYSPPQKPPSTTNPSITDPLVDKAGLYLSTNANVDQVVRNQQQEIMSWDGFGNNQGVLVQQGFSIASPMFFLQSGERTITLVLEFHNALPHNFFNDSQFYLSTGKSWFSVTKLVTSPADVETNTDTQAESTNIINIKLTLLESAPAIVPFIDKVDGYTSQWPLLKVILGKSIDLYNPPILLSVSIETDIKNFSKLNLANDISPLPASGPSLIFGPIPTVGSCFYIGSSEIFAKPLTDLTITLAWENLPQDFSGYYAQYNNFLDPQNKSIAFSNTAFEGQWTLLTQKTWKELPLSSAGKSPVSIALFQQPADKTTSNNPGSIFTFSFDQTTPYVPSPDLISVPLPLPGQAGDGYVCLELTAPNHAFGYNLYPKVVANVSMINAQLLMQKAKPDDSGSFEKTIEKIIAAVSKIIAGIEDPIKNVINNIVEFIKKILKHDNEKDSDAAKKGEVQISAVPAEEEKSDIQPMPDLPYSPKQSGLLVNYTAKVKTEVAMAIKSTVNNSDQHNYPFQLYHYGSFQPYLAFDSLSSTKQLGLLNLTPVVLAPAEQIRLFPGVSGQGVLYLAIENLLAPCTLSIWMELSQDNNLDELTAESVGYYYWSASGWTPLKVLENDTNNLNCSGIMVFEIPELNTEESREENLTYLPSPVMQGNDFWLAIVAQKANLAIKFSYINTQAIKLGRTTLTSLPLGQSPSIDALSISTTKEKMVNISNIIQPFGSTGGAAAEDKNSYYWRVSGRINHKDRISSVSNYDAMAKTACPHLFYVKTLTPASNRVASEKTNGLIQLGVVNGYANSQLPNAFRPQINACDKTNIIKYINARISAMAKVNVFNLYHQLVTIDVALNVKTLANANALSRQINQELKIYLSPWILSDLPQINIQQGISRAALIHFLTRYEGVVDLATLNIFVSPAKGTESAIDEQSMVLCQDDVVAPVEKTIFVSALQHSIHINLCGTSSQQKEPSSLSKIVEVPIEY